MKLAVPTEITSGERRVALVPESVKKLVQAGYKVAVQRGAGTSAYISDAEYVEAGADIEKDVKTLFSTAHLVLKVAPPIKNDKVGQHEAGMMKAGAILLGTLAPLSHLEAVAKLAQGKITAFSTDCIPRITRAQRMDTLSSMATVAGYKAVLIAACSVGKFLPMLMTAAGTIRPCKVFVLGAGVAGLQAIATARRLGAVVDAYDARAVVKEQVQSLGATFIELNLPKQDAETKGGYAKQMSEEFLTKQRAELARCCAQQDIVITTALIFGKKAPLLITEEAVKGMKTGSVIMDLAAQQEGNCELTKPGKVIVKHGVTIHGDLNLPATMPLHASQMYSRNLTAFVMAFTKDGKFKLDMEDEIIKGAMITHQGEVIHSLTQKALKESQGVG